MSGPLDGIKVIEVSSWMFIPSAGAVLVDWGADVIKIEHPETGDPQRGLVTSGLLPGGPDGVNFMMEQPNHGKRSVAIDLSHPDGREALLKLVETADIFLTNYMPAVRRKLRIDVDDIRERNPDIVIARGTGQGPKGPDAEKGGYDGASFWARGGVASVMPDKDGWPMGQPAPAFGDVIGGLSVAGAIAAALVKRERTGEASVVDALDELYEDPQVIANGYLPTMTASNGQDVQLVASPAQFDETPVEITRCPEHGEHTETTLLEAGFDWEQLAALKESGAIL